MDLLEKGGLQHLRRGHLRRFVPTARQLLLACMVAGSLALLLQGLSARGWGRGANLPFQTAPEQPLLSGHTRKACPQRVPWLDELRVPHPFNFTRRVIAVRPRQGLERASSTHIAGALLPPAHVIDRDQNNRYEWKGCMKPLLLEVPAPKAEAVDASHLLFGLQTPMDRLEDSLPSLQRSFAHTRAKLVIMTITPEGENPTLEQLSAMQSRMQDMGIDATLVTPLGANPPMEIRYFSLLKVLNDHRSPQTQWAVLIDDDTFFPSMQSLLSTLRGYDVNSPIYLGAHSELWSAIVLYGFMAFGGAGVFLTMPLLDRLNELYDVCVEQSHSSAGDLRVHECILWNTHTRLTHVDGLHQVDMTGDLSGLFESGRQFLSLHHWKQEYWGAVHIGTARADQKPWIPMDAMHLVADVCDTCFLQRWVFDNDTVLTNGFSVASYPTGILKNASPHGGLNLVELTWDKLFHDEERNSKWDTSLGPMRPALSLDEDKIQYKLLDAFAVDGGVRQYYYRLGAPGEIDNVIELFWIREKDF